jgi:hypothetical protein
MRLYIERSSDVGPSSLRLFCPGCIIATRGYDFREGQVLDKLLDAGLELHFPDHSDLEAEVAQSTAQVILQLFRSEFRAERVEPYGARSSRPTLHPEGCSSSCFSSSSMPSRMNDEAFPSAVLPTAAMRRSPGSFHDPEPKASNLQVRRTSSRRSLWVNRCEILLPDIVHDAVHRAHREFLEVKQQISTQR